jgi:tRNA1Val (adenine37-N6)-methyltransferase
VAHPLGTDSFLLGAWADVSAPCDRILDIGTGSGILALMLAQRTERQHPPPQIDAAEIHPASAQCARNNIAAAPWSDRMRVWEGTIQTFTPGVRYDLLVSNPPYFNETIVSPDEDRRQARATVSLSFNDLLEAALRLLSPDGRFCIVLPEKEARFFYQTAATRGLYLTRRLEVRARAGRPVERILLQMERNPLAFRREEMEIYEYGTTYTEAYRALVAAFYV